jgi:hypothetical protein
LSHAWHADLAVGIDINPLPLLVAQTLLAGREFKFHEVPASPRSAHEPTVARTLQGRADLGGKLQLVLADGLDPPFAEGSFDTIIADWFFDQVVPDLEAYLPLLRSLMSADGVLLHHGPLVYPSTTPRSHRHTPEELFEQNYRSWNRQRVTKADSSVSSASQLAWQRTSQLRNSTLYPNGSFRTIFPFLVSPALSTTTHLTRSLRRWLAQLTDAVRARRLPGKSPNSRSSVLRP